MAANRDPERVSARAARIGTRPTARWVPIAFVAGGAVGFLLTLAYLLIR